MGSAGWTAGAVSASLSASGSLFEVPVPLLDDELLFDLERELEELDLW